MAMQGNFWSRLSPRERVLIFAMVLTFFVMGTVMLVYMRGRALESSREEIDAYREAINKIHTRGAVYEERLANKRQREADIATKELLFSTLLEDAQRGIQNFSVSDQEELPIVDLGDGLVKRTFEFKLRGVKLQDAITFLTAIESQPQRIILTEKLKVRSLSPQDNSLNFDVSIATWERRERSEKEKSKKSKDEGKSEEDES